MHAQVPRSICRLPLHPPRTVWFNRWCLLNHLCLDDPSLISPSVLIHWAFPLGLPPIRLHRSVCFPVLRSLPVIPLFRSRFPLRDRFSLLPLSKRPRQFPDDLSESRFSLLMLIAAFDVACDNPLPSPSDPLSLERSWFFDRDHLLQVLPDRRRNVPSLD